MYRSKQTFRRMDWCKLIKYKYSDIITVTNQNIFNCYGWRLLWFNAKYLVNIKNIFKW